MDRNKLASWVRTATAPWNIRGFPRLLYASRHHLLGRDRRFFEVDGAFGLFLDPDDYVHCMMFYDRYSREILNAFRRFVSPGDSVIDVGAHIGYFTLHLARLVTPAGKVFSFEPDPRALGFLEESVFANRMDWVEVFPVALAASSGSIGFYLAKGLGSSSAVKSVQQVGATATVVRTVSLDQLVQEGKITGRVCLVKIDIEGFELEAIRGMRRLLEDSRPVMVVEVNEEMLKAQGERPSTLFELLKSLGYKIEALVKPGRGKYKRSIVTRPLGDIAHEDGYYDILCLPS